MGSSRTSFRLIENFDLPLTMSPQVVVLGAAAGVGGIPTLREQTPFPLLIAKKVKWVHAAGATAD